MSRNSKIAGRIICICSIILKSNLLQAQVIDKTVLAKFDASVITKLYNIASRNTLSPQLQYDIAAYFKKADSTTKEWLILGKSKAQIDSLQKASSLVLFSLEHLTDGINAVILNDSTTNISFIKEGYVLPLSQFTIALKCKDSLKLTQAVADSLIYYIAHMAARQDSLQQLEPFTWVDFGAYESFHLSQLLTEEQYTHLLSIKNKPGASSDAKKDWAEIERRGLDKAMNKVQIINEITDYYVKRYCSWNRFAHDSKKQIADVRSLEEIKPQVLKLLDAARWNGEAENSDNNLKLQW